MGLFVFPSPSIKYLIALEQQYIYSKLGGRRAAWSKGELSAFNVKLLDAMWMFVRSHLCCCFSREPAWFLSLAGGFLGPLVLAGSWCGVRSRGIAAAGWSWTDKGVGAPCRAAHGCFI